MQLHLMRIRTHCMDTWRRVESPPSYFCLPECYLSSTVERVHEQNRVMGKPTKGFAVSTRLFHATFTESILTSSRGASEERLSWAPTLLRVASPTPNPLSVSDLSCANLRHRTLGIRHFRFKDNITCSSHTCIS